MNATNRKSEIIEAMSSFSKNRCNKSELLPELLQLQTELVNLTFNGEHAENARLKTWDVVNHLTKLNEDRGHIADEHLQRFSLECKQLNECIRGEINGVKGENKALRSIETVRTKHSVMRNIELSSGDHLTELDLIVFTRKAIFVVEVKNPMRDIVIDEKGNYCRVNNGFSVFDKNIGEKMNDKNYLLRNVLQEAGIENPNIASLLVFTNYNITVSNNFPFIRHCFLSSLPHIIDTYEGEDLYDDETISHMIASVDSAKYCGNYSLPLDINQFKQDFADLMIALENVPETAGEVTVQEETLVETASTAPLWVRCAKKALAIVPVAGLIAVTAIGFGKFSRQ